jgi:glycosyltransferase involved in cell wall biosynthesis
VRAKDLSIIVPGRNEAFHRHTVEDLLAHTGEGTEIIVVADGGWPDPPIIQHPRVQVLHFGEAIGQRAATNAGAQVSRAKYICKMDAHCSVDDGFDVKMLAKMEPDMTMIPAMNRLHVFDWMCECGEREYQGAKPDKCKECGGTEFTMAMVWQPRLQYAPTTTWVFDSSLHFGYDRKGCRNERFKALAPSGLVETMTCIGACFLMERERFWELGGMEDHGNSQGWGQYGVELAAKAWLSGGRMVTNLDTHFSHLFRTGNFARNGSPWPYEIRQADIDRARKHSRELWWNNSWPQQKFPLSWLVEKFWPVPGWTDADLKKLKESERGFVPAE